MSPDGALQSRAAAAADYQRARRQAALSDLLMRLRGEPSELLSYEDVRDKLHASETSLRSLEDIPLDSIVGSVGRYQEFSRGFLPRKYISSRRWVGVKVAMTGLKGVPPIEVYRIGQACFVQDGNHRVSVAREMGLDSLSAYVTEVHTSVPLAAHASARDVIIAAELADFIARTGVDRLLPHATLRLTAAGQYPVLLEHIEVHRYFMGIEAGHAIADDEAVRHWYSAVYMPVAQMIRAHGLLRDFPQRTEADLYLWLSRHRAELADSLGWDVSLDVAATDLGAPRRPRRLASERLHAVLPASPGAQDSLVVEGATQLASQPVTQLHEDRVVSDLLVVVDDSEGGDRALSMALAIAERENARLHGLALCTPAKSMQQAFDDRCRAARVPARLAFERGDAVAVTSRRARFADMVVTPFEADAKQPGASKLLSSGLRGLLRRCPRPVLAVPPPRPDRAASEGPVRRALLAYDASPKAGEALLIAAYLAGWWDIELRVVTVADSERRHAVLGGDISKVLTERGLAARHILASGRVSAAILDTARSEACDLVVMGGYGHGAALEFVLGSATRNVLRSTSVPVLVFQ